MLPREDAYRFLARALREMAPEWELASPCMEITVRDSEHWLSGIGTFGVTLRHQTTGALKVLGRRRGALASASYHRGISFLVLEAYASRNTDPIRRFFREIGVTSGARPALGYRSVAMFKPA